MGTVKNAIELLLKATPGKGYFFDDICDSLGVSASHRQSVSSALELLTRKGLFLKTAAVNEKNPFAKYLYSYGKLISDHMPEKSLPEKSLPEKSLPEKSLLTASAPASVEKAAMPVSTAKTLVPFAIITDRVMPNFKERSCTRYPFAEMKVGTCFYVGKIDKRLLSRTSSSISNRRKKIPTEQYQLERTNGELFVWRVA